MKQNIKNKINHQSGAAMLISVLFFLFISLAIVFGLISPAVQGFKNRAMDLDSKKSYFLAESGAEDAFYRIKKNIPITFPSTLSLNGGSAIINSSVVGSNEQEIIAVGNIKNHIRSVSEYITTTDGFEFSFAVQVGLGGLRMKNDSSVVGNVYSDGQIEGDDKNKNFITGDAVSSGLTGLIKKTHVYLDAYANTFNGSKIDGDAYYQLIDGGTSVAGQEYPGSADLPPTNMPIPDTLLDQWEADATAGGVISSPCPYNITSSVTLGPKKINCDVTIRGNSSVVITLLGTVYINGNLSIKDKPKFKVDDSVGNKSVPIIARSTASPQTSGWIDLDNTPTFYGSEANGVANPDSYVMLISRNTSSENGGAVKAISAGNHVGGNLLLYAPHGLIELSNDVVLREVTSYQLTLKNHAQVYYTIGLKQPLFTSGPGGKWKIKRIKEIR
jgi:hypothetical protein